MLDRNRFIVKEHVKFLSSAATYDILDAETGERLATAQEKISGLIKLARWFISKALMPTRVEVRLKENDELVFAIRRGVYFFKSRVEVLDSENNMIGYFRSKIFTLSGGFHIYDKNDKHCAEIKGKLFGFDYRFLTPEGDMEIGRVAKKLAVRDLLKEMFTSADTYGVEVNPELEDESLARILVLAAALAIDIIYKAESTKLDV